jgi:hypothetical protein
MWRADACVHFARETTPVSAASDDGSAGAIGWGGGRRGGVVGGWRGHDIKSGSGGRGDLVEHLRISLHEAIVFHRRTTIHSQSGGGGGGLVHRLLGLVHRQERIGVLDLVPVEHLVSDG